MRWFRHADPRYPFLWESPAQPTARWHGPGEGPAQYLADTPAGAWAEHLRHEAITDPEDLADVTRSLWAIEVDEVDRGKAQEPSLSRRVLTGGLTSYRRCQEEARRLRARGATVLLAPSAALLPGGATPQRTRGGLRPGPPADGEVLVLFGRRPELDGWRIVEGAKLDPDLVGVTRPL